MPSWVLALLAPLWFMNIIHIDSQDNNHFDYFLFARPLLFQISTILTQCLFSSFAQHVLRMTVPWKECALPENTQKVAKSCHRDFYSTDMSFNFPLHPYQGDKRHAGSIFKFICLRISTWSALPWCNQEGTMWMRFQIDNCFFILKQNITMIIV